MCKTIVRKVKETETYGEVILKSSIKRKMTNKICKKTKQNKTNLQKRFIANTFSTSLAYMQFIILNRAYTFEKESGHLKCQ